MLQYLKTFICKDVCISMFIAALFTVAKTWKQPKYPLMDDWINMLYTYTMEYYSVIRKGEILPFVTAWMVPDTIIPAK